VEYGPATRSLDLQKLCRKKKIRTIRATMALSHSSCGSQATGCVEGKERRLDMLQKNGQPTDITLVVKDGK